MSRCRVFTMAAIAGRGALVALTLVAGSANLRSQILRPLTNIPYSTFGDIFTPSLATDGTSVYFVGGPSPIGPQSQALYNTLGRFTPGIGLTRLALWNGTPFPQTQVIPFGPLVVVGGDIWFTTQALNVPNDNGIGHWSPTSGLSFAQIPQTCGHYVGPNGPQIGAGQLAVLGSDLYFATPAGALHNFGALCKMATTTGQITKLVDFPGGIFTGAVANMTPVGGYLVWIGSNFFGSNLVTYDTASGSIWASAYLGNPGLGGPNAPTVPELPMASDGTAARFVTTVTVAGVSGQRLYEWNPSVQSLTLLRGFTPLAPNAPNLSRIIEPATGAEILIGGSGMFHWDASMGISTLSTAYFASFGGFERAASLGDRIIFSAPLPPYLFGGGAGLWEWTFGPDPATSTSLGAGCSSVGAAPVFASTAPAFGSLVTMSVTGAPTNWPGFLFYSAPPTSTIPVAPGCDVWLDLAGLTLLANAYTNTSGVWNFWTGSFPENGYYTGLQFRMQALFLSPTGTDFALTNGIEFVIGY